MAEGGFDDIEMKNKNVEEDEEEEYKEVEIDFGGDDIEEYPDNFDESSKTEFNRVDTLSKLKKDAGNMKRRITTVSKKDFREFFKIDINKKDGENSKI